MSGVKIKVEVTALSQALRRTASRCRRLRPAFAEIGEMLVRSVQKNFQAGGRPDRWVGRKSPAKTPGSKLLIDTGRLVNSITSRHTNSYAEVGTNVVYGATHQFGRGPIPARPFLVVQADDERAFAEVIAEHIAEPLK